MKKILFLLCILIAHPALTQDSLNVRSLFNWDDPQIPIGFEAMNNQYNDVWGYAADGREYAFLGSTLGVHVFDVTVPENTVLIDHVPGRFSGAGVIHRDYKIYAGHLYATCDQGSSSLQIMDLQYLPDSVHLVYDSDELFVRAHNIQIDTVNARLYTNGGTDHFSIYSIADPASPSLLVDCEADIPWWGNTVGYVHDCFVRDNIVWCNDEDGMHVIDFTDINAPILLGSLTDYPGEGYNHSGWMNDDGTLYVMADETHGSPLKFVDATDLSDLQVISTVTTGVDPMSIVHNPFFTGDRVHVAYYQDGYWLWDAADPLQPVLIGFYDTSVAPHENYHGAWGVYPYLPSGNILVSDMQTGLWILEVEDVTSIADRSEDRPFLVRPTITSGLIDVLPLRSVDRFKVEVFDAAGRSVRSMQPSRSAMKLDLCDLRAGVYLVSIESEGKRFTQRIIKSEE